MEKVEQTKAYRQRARLISEWGLQETDPELMEILENFALKEVIDNDDLDERTRYISILSSLIGSQALEVFKQMLPIALDFQVTAVEVKEIVYQAVAYLGIGRVMPFLLETNQILGTRGIRLPLEGQKTTNEVSRRQKGEQAQIDIFGEQMRGFADTEKEEKGNINKWLTENCFGDYYTRSGLSGKMREMITFCFLAAQGGCEAQLKSHAAANMRIGNDKIFLINVISQCLPYIGYPRSLNAAACVNAISQIQ